MHKMFPVYMHEVKAFNEPLAGPLFTHRCKLNYFNVRLQSQPLGVAAHCGAAAEGSDGAWLGNLLLASHSSYCGLIHNMAD